MIIVAEIRRRARLIAGPVAGISLVVYFSYHLIAGDRGFLAWRHLSDEIRIAQVQLGEAQAARDALDRRVNLLRPNHLDRDMLDERARAALNLAGPNERVIFDARPPQ
ncbi:MAG TPA: septum formation initiator family protein [Stellaceae bacterium]|nr:septum formation initiator family protein [Stellaceae bacterium]